MTDQNYPENALEELTMLFGQLTHELRAPTTALRGFTELLERELVGPLNKDQQELVHHMSRISRDITHTIQQFIAFHGVAFQDKTAEIQNYPIYTLVEDAVSWAKRNNPNTTVVANILHLSEQVEVVTDLDHARMILFQIVDNAIRFNVNEGSVQVSVQRVEQAVIVDVKDTGKGIPSAHQAKLFVKDHPVPFTDPRLRYGTGFGLRIAYLLAQISNIRISLLKSEKEGSIFRLFLEIYER